MASSARGAVAKTVPALTLRQLLELCCKAPVHLAMFDVQGEEKRIFASADVKQLMAARPFERVMVGIHRTRDDPGGSTTLHTVKEVLEGAGYKILLEQQSVPAQPDGVLIAAAPHVSPPLAHLLQHDAKGWECFASRRSACLTMVPHVCLVTPACLPVRHCCERA